MKIPPVDLIGPTGSLAELMAAGDPGDHECAVCGVPAGPGAAGVVAYTLDGATLFFSSPIATCGGHDPVILGDILGNDPRIPLAPGSPYAARITVLPPGTTTAQAYAVAINVSELCVATFREPKDLVDNVAAVRAIIDQARHAAGVDPAIYN